MARLGEAEGSLDSALNLLHEAEHLYVNDFFPNVRPIAALRQGVGRRGQPLSPRLGKGAGPVSTGRPLLLARIRAYYPGRCSGPV